MQDLLRNHNNQNGTFRLLEEKKVERSERHFWKRKADNVSKWNSSMRLEKRAPLKHDRSLDTPLSILLVSAAVFCKMKSPSNRCGCYQGLARGYGRITRHSKGPLIIPRPLWDLIGGQISNPKVSDERYEHFLSNNALWFILGQVVWSQFLVKIR